MNDEGGTGKGKAKGEEAPCSASGRDCGVWSVELIDSSSVVSALESELAVSKICAQGRDTGFTWECAGLPSMAVE